MEIEEVKNGYTLVMTPEGRLDAQSAQPFQERILRRIQEGEKAILLDFSKIDYISSAGLRALLTAAKRLKESGGRLAICLLTDQVREVFKISGFDAVVEIHPDQETALQKLS
jgi:anti-sigma B factor antagonist